MSEEMTATIPFTGFYNTYHDAIICDAASALCRDESGEENEEKLNEIYDQCTWRLVHEAYALEYAERFSMKFGITCEFDELNSPREYNFATDRIFISLPFSEVRRMMNEIPDGVLWEVAKDRHSSCSGFVSFYSSDVWTWGDVETWDHNQVATLIIAYLRGRTDEEDGFNQEELMETAQCNGYIENWICESTPNIDSILSEVAA